MLIPLASIGGFVAVALGAFGAHALDGKLDDKAAGWWETATFYLLVHSLAALAIGLSSIYTSAPQAYRLSGPLLLGGAMVFAGTLYAMALGAPRWFGAITPIGGVLMLLGWAAIAWAGMRTAG